jgi:hypothetical protein
VIFVSSHDTAKEKMSGYEAGGCDYVVKPVAPSEVLKKAQLAISNREQYEQLHRDKSSAFNTAMVALTNAGELGVILEFMRTSFTLTSFAALAKSIADCLERYSLKCIVHVRDSKGETLSTSNGTASPLESELLFKLKDDGRILEFQKWAVLNFSGISILVKNMPEDDDRRGRLRDHLAMLIEAAAARLHTLTIETKLNNLLNDCKTSLREISTEQQQFKGININVFDRIKSELRLAFLGQSHDLTFEQEEIMFNIVENGINQALTLYDAGALIDERMNKIVAQLSDALVPPSQ